MNPGARKLLTVITSLVGLTLAFKILQGPRHPDTKEEVSDRKGHRECSKRTKIAFLKTHKCASSSVQNMLMRFGLENELNFVLPSAGNYLGRYVPYSRAMVANTPWDRLHMEYDVFCLHTIWSRAEVAATLGPSAATFTIMRDPVELFESLWSYAGLGSYYNTDLETFAISPKEGLLAQRAFRNLGRNQMLWDSGLAAGAMDNMTAVDNKIAEMDNTFSLVMIAERWDESVILLKDLLCWDFKDVVNFKLNARKENKKIPLSAEARAALKEYLAADYKLYNHFKKKFEAQVNSFGTRRMEQELEILGLANANMKERCGINKVDNDKVSGDNKLWGQGLVAYTAGNESQDAECKWFATSEMSFIDHLREVQGERAKELASDLNINLNDIEDSVHESMKRLPSFKNGLPDIEKLKAMYIHS